MNRREFLQLSLLGAAGLAFARPAFAKTKYDLAATLSAPPLLTGIDAAITTASPLVDALSHEIFGGPTVERMPGLQKQIALDRYLISTVRNDQVLFLDRDVNPVAIFTLPKNTSLYHEWERASPHEQHEIMKGAAADVLSQVVAENTTLRRADVDWLVGRADTFAAAVKRYAPFAPYLEQIAAAYGLDHRIGTLAVMESDFMLYDQSLANCEGVFQIAPDEQRAAGLLMTAQHKPKKWPKRKTWLHKRPDTADIMNEVYHPILAAEAAYGILTGNVCMSGGLLNAIQAYNCGFGNWTKMALLVKQHPYVQSTHQDVLPFFAKYTGKGENALAGLESGLRKDAKRDASWYLAQMMLQWRNSWNETTYQQESARYLRRILAGISAADWKGTGIAAWNGECIRVQYKNGKSIRGKDLRALCSDDHEYARLNPHIAQGATVLEGTRVFLPIGAAQELQRKHALHASDITVYHNGSISPNPHPGTFADPHKRYGTIGRMRYEGRYGKVAESEIAHLHDAFKQIAAAEPTCRNRSLRFASANDLDLYNWSMYQKLRELT